MTLFALSLPALVVLIIAIASFKLMYAKVTGKPRPSSASVGIDMFDLLLRPGSEHRIAEEERKTVFRENTEGADPFSKISPSRRKSTTGRTSK